MILSVAAASFCVGIELKAEISGQKRRFSGLESQE
jgi:hypothetical protein